MARTILVGNLYEKVTEEELRDLFEEYGGEIERIRLRLDRNTGKRSNSATVIMRTESGAELIFDRLQGVELKGQLITVTLASDRPLT
jgi:RNA recognition motif-containing protein